MNHQIICEETLEDKCTKIDEVCHYGILGVNNDVLFYNESSVDGISLTVVRCGDLDTAVYYPDFKVFQHTLNNGKLYFIEGNKLISTSLDGYKVEFEIEIQDVDSMDELRLSSVNEDKFVFNYEKDTYFIVVDGKVEKRFDCLGISNIEIANINGNEYIYTHSSTEDSLFDENKNETIIENWISSEGHKVLYYIIGNFINDNVYVIYSDENSECLVCKVNDDLTTQQILSINIRNTTVLSVDSFSVYFAVNCGGDHIIYRYTFPSKAKSARK